MLLDQLHFIGSEEALQGIVAGQVLVRDLFVVRGMAPHEIFVGAQKRFGGCVAIMPHQDHPAPGVTMRANSSRVSSGRNQWNACPAMTKSALASARSGGFGAAFHHAEVGKCRQIVLTGDAHFAIGFDTDDAITVLQEYLCQQPGAAADVGYGVPGTQPASLAAMPALRLANNEGGT